MSRGCPDCVGRAYVSAGGLRNAGQSLSFFQLSDGACRAMVPVKPWGRNGPIGGPGVGLAVYGPDHPTVGTDLGNLGRVLEDLGDLQGAKANLERALAVHLAVYGPDHPTVGTDLGNLGRVLEDLGDLQGAKANLERALAIARAAYGPDPPIIEVDHQQTG